MNCSICSTCCWAARSPRLSTSGSRGFWRMTRRPDAYTSTISTCTCIFANGRRPRRLPSRGTRGEERGMAGSPTIYGEEGFGVRDSGFGIRGSGSPSVGSSTSSPEPPVPPIVIDLSSTTHYPLPTSHFSVGSWAFSYMVATVIMGVAILGFWAYEITHHQHIAEAPSQSVPSDARPEMGCGRRITGRGDVKWSDDPRFLPPLSSRAYVPLGRKYILSSGLLEITYDSGAKVILQGPCTYEVESTAGGYLALGKLTARIGERGEGRGESAKPQAANQKLEIRNQKSPSSFILHPSSFILHPYSPSALPPPSSPTWAQSSPSRWTRRAPARHMCSRAGSRCWCWVALLACPAVGAR